ncbi:MAG TPA: hypothetical protein DIT97_04755 [Gimesia maris]|uniref:Uncharacterized protein n=1 Tax=Gimesia maris TaxID=122 RepID=A0A3D3R0L3_9PLAN|nr:hypothetical protein [Gimesia maris]|tara:strand:+ start:50253 stop:51044 length:792 start_codon:yes stop_codon:yes gene_type:complete
MSTATLFSPYYEPVVANRFFAKHIKYDEVYRDRGDLRKMVDVFEVRIRDWYIDPIEVLLETNVRGWRLKIARWLGKRDHGGHYSFTVMAMTCLLIDTLSQFEKGLPEGTRSVFKDFIRNNLPSYGGSVVPPIDGYRLPRRGTTTPQHEPLRDLAEVLYAGFRCGILHQAHAPLYCGIVPGNKPPSIETSDHATYGSGATVSVSGDDCPVVVVQPAHLYSEVMVYFGRYLSNLKDSDSQHDGLRDHFKTKFADSFGIDVFGATL